MSLPEHDSWKPAEMGGNAAVATALAPDTPMPTPPAATDDVVELPVGLRLADRLIRTARVRELTGADEEIIARAAASSHPEVLVDALLSRGVVELGGQAPDALTLERLAVGDRDALILGIRRVTFGDEITFDPFHCATCGYACRVVVGLDEIPVTRAETPGELEFDVSLRKGRRARVRMLCGADQTALIKAARDGGLTGAEQDTLLLSRLVIALVGGEPGGDVRHVNGDRQAMRELSMSDRARILKAVTGSRLGPQQDQVKITCISCKAECEVPISIPNMFRD